MTHHPTLLVTDSGLGGLSVFGEMVEKLAVSSPWPRVSMVYFNAWPEEDKGYNHYPDMDFKARVFQNALEAMAGFTPDQILIACNTLSVIYEHTAFAQAPMVPVQGIVQTGVDMVAQALEADPDAGVILFGTPTTTESGVHARALVEQGIDPDRILNQGCVNLAGKIERRPFGAEVETKIKENAEKAAQQVKRRSRERGKTFSRLYLALCCTHFGYRDDLFIKEMEAASGIEARILNPNQAMAANALAHAGEDTGPAQLELTLLSRVPWEEDRIRAYETLFETRSPRVVTALKNYQLNPDLFQI